MGDAGGKAGKLTEGAEREAKVVWACVALDAGVDWAREKDKGWRSPALTWLVWPDLLPGTNPSTPNLGACAIAMLHRLRANRSTRPPVSAPSRAPQQRRLCREAARCCVPVPRALKPRRVCPWPEYTANAPAAPHGGLEEPRATLAPLRCLRCLHTAGRLLANPPLSRSPPTRAASYSACHPRLQLFFQRRANIL